MRKNQARGFTFLQSQGIASLVTQNHLRPLWPKAIVRTWWEIPMVTKWVPEPKFPCVEGAVSYTTNRQFLDHSNVCKNSSQFWHLSTQRQRQSPGAAPQNCPPPPPDASCRPGCYSCASDLLAADWRFQRPLQLKMPIASCYLYFWPTSYINQTGYKSEVPITPAPPWVWLTCQNGSQNSEKYLTY